MIATTPRQTSLRHSRRSWLWPMLMAATVWGFSACSAGAESTSDSTTTIPPATTTTTTTEPPTADVGADGAWLVDGYGDVYVAESGRVVAHYQPAGGWCVDPDERWVDEFPLELIGDDRATFDGGDKSYVLSRIELPAGCLDLDAEVKPGAPIEAFVDLMDRYYPFFDERGIDWDGARAGLLAAAQTATSTDEAAGAIADFTAVLGDGHTYIAAETDVSRPEGRPGTDWRSERSRINTYLGDTAQSRADGLVTYGFLGDGVGYLRVGEMFGFADEIEDEVAAFSAVVDEALKAMEGTDTLIVDLRSNGGGLTAFVSEFVGHFVDEPTDMVTIEAHLVPESRQPFTAEPTTGERYRGEVIVLVDGATASAAENTAEGLRVAGATVIGSQTHGIWSDVNQWLLPGGYEMGMSNEIWRTIDGEVLEIVGVPIDVETDPDEALLAALTDDQVAALPEWDGPSPADVALSEEEALQKLRADLGAPCAGVAAEMAPTLTSRSAELCDLAFADAIAELGPGIVDDFDSGNLSPGDVLQPYLQAVIETQ